MRPVVTDQSEYLDTQISSTTKQQRPVRPVNYNETNGHQPLLQMSDDHLPSFKTKNSTKDRTLADDNSITLHLLQQQESEARLKKVFEQNMRGAPKAQISDSNSLAYDPSQDDSTVIWKVNNVETQRRDLARKRMMNWEPQSPKLPNASRNGKANRNALLSQSLTPALGASLLQTPDLTKRTAQLAQQNSELKINNSSLRIYEARHNSQVTSSRYPIEPKHHVMVTNDIDAAYKLNLQKKEDQSGKQKSLYFGSQRDFDPAVKQDVYQIALKQLNDERKQKFSIKKHSNKFQSPKGKNLNKVGQLVPLTFNEIGRRSVGMTNSSEELNMFSPLSQSVNLPKGNNIFHTALIQQQQQQQQNLIINHGEGNLLNDDEGYMSPSQIQQTELPIVNSAAYSFKFNSPNPPKIVSPQRQVKINKKESCLDFLAQLSQKKEKVKQQPQDTKPDIDLRSPDKLKDKKLYGLIKNDMDEAQKMPTIGECHQMLIRARERARISDANQKYTKSMLGRDKDFISRAKLHEVPQAQTEEQILHDVEIKADKQRKRMAHQELVLQGKCQYDLPTLDHMNQHCVFYNQHRREQLTFDEVQKKMPQFVRVELQTTKNDKLRAVEPTLVEDYVTKYLKYIDVFKALQDNFKGKIKTQVLSQLTKHNKSTRIYGDKMKDYKIDQGVLRFKQIIQEDEDLFKIAAQEILEKVSFLEIFRKNQGAKILDVRAEDAKFQYLKQCQEDTALCLPILDKITDKTLALYSYTLSIGHARAMAQACKYFQNSIRKVLMQNCGLDDEEFSVILEAFSYLKEFKSLSYIQNSYDEASQEAMLPILKRKVPNQLDELKMINCQITGKVSSDLIHSIQDDNRLMSLTLIHVNMTDEAFECLTEIVAESKYLQHLDISWCERNFEDFHDFYEMLANNRRLKSLNMSWNSLFSPKGPDYNPNEVSDADEESIMNLERFIKRNQNLNHLDFSYCGIQEPVFKRIIGALNRSKSMRCIHLDGNPPAAIPEMLEWVVDRLHAVDPYKSPVNHITHPPKIKQPGSQQAAMNPKDMQETLRLKAIQHALRVNEQKLDIPTTEKSKLIISRNIGFKHVSVMGDKKYTPKLKDEYLNEENNQLGGPIAQWRIINTDYQGCYICGLHMPAFVFWSKNSAPVTQTNIVGELHDYYVKKSQALFDKVKTDPKVPYIQGEFTNWQPVPLLEITEMCIRVTKTPIPDFEDHCLYHDKVTKDRKGNISEEGWAIIAEEERQWRLLFYKDWVRTILNSIPYKKPTLLGGKDILDLLELQTDLEKNQVHCGFFFLKPGRHYYVVRHEGKTYLNKELVRCRQEPIPKFVKQKESKKRVSSSQQSGRKIFRKEQSQFKEIQLDSDEIINKCYKYDRNSWKLVRFVRQEADREMLFKYLKDNYETIKNCFSYLATLSQKPSLNFRDFMGFVVKLNIMDHQFNKDVIYEQFLETNKDAAAEDSENENPMDELVRYEFVEILVRMADYKFKRTGEKTSYSEAFGKLWAEYVEPWYQEQTKVWAGFKSDQLLTQEVNDLIDKNRTRLDAVYARYEKKQKNPDNVLTATPIVGLTIQDLKQMMDDCNIEVSLEQISMVFGMSKQTVVNDNDVDGQRKLTVLTPVEFLEFIGRIAAVKFINTEMQELSLVTKISYIMDDLFEIINSQRVLIEEPEIQNSESDEDY